MRIKFFPYLVIMIPDAEFSITLSAKTGAHWHLYVNGYMLWYAAWPCLWFFRKKRKLSSQKWSTVYNWN